MIALLTTHATSSAVATRAAVVFDDRRHHYAAQASAVTIAPPSRTGMAWGERRVEMAGHQRVEDGRDEHQGLRTHAP